MKKQQKGITLIALVITIIILLILAGVTINIVINGGMIEKSQTAVDKYGEESAREKLALKLVDMQAEKIINNRDYTTNDYDYLTEQLKKEGFAVEEDIVTVDGWIFEIDRNVPKIGKEKSDMDFYKGGKELLSEIIATSSLIEVEYTPQKNEESISVLAEYNGNIPTQTFTQTSLGAIGSGENKLKWYVLNVDDDGILLISEPTKSKVSFGYLDGYNNALYYLNELSSKFFENSDYDTVAHAFRLSDLRDAVVNINGNDYNFQTNFVETCYRIF